MEKFEESIDALVKSLVSANKTDTATQHITYEVTDEELGSLSDGVTIESLNKHVVVINKLAVGVTQATSEITHSANKDNDKVLSMDGTLDLGGIVINSDYYLKQDVEDDVVYGASYTTVDYQYEAALSAYHDACLTSNLEKAEKLFK